MTLWKIGAVALLFFWLGTLIEGKLVFFMAEKQLKNNFISINADLYACSPVKPPLEESRP